MEYPRPEFSSGRSFLADTPRNPEWLWIQKNSCCVGQCVRVHSQLPVRQGGATGYFLRGTWPSTKNERDEQQSPGSAADSVDDFWI
jgi:hypothetical protein